MVNNWWATAPKNRRRRRPLVYNWWATAPKNRRRRRPLSSERTPHPNSLAPRGPSEL